MLTQEYLKECFTYEDDKLYWKVRPKHHFNNKGGRNSFNKLWPGKIAGFTKTNKATGKTYRTIRVNKKKHLAHNLIWLLLTGEDPVQIDHIDGDGINNKFSNLRNATMEENVKNKRLHANNSSGIPGVSWNKKDSGWQVFIGVSGKKTYLGFKKSLFDAACLRKSAEILYEYHENHGTERPL